MATRRLTKSRATRPAAGIFPRIRKLTPRGFLSFAPDFPGVELGDLNVFIGANGSGKSNLFEAARFLQEAQRNVRGFLSSGEVKDWQWASALDQEPAVVEAQLALTDVQLKYWLGFAQSGSGDVEFTSEGLELVGNPVDQNLFWRLEPTVVDFFVRRNGQGRRVSKEPIEAAKTVLDELRHPTDDRHRKDLRTALSSLSFFGEWGFGRRSNRLKGTQASATVHGGLLEDGSNAAARLNSLLQRRGFEERLIAHAASVLPNVDGVLADFNMGSTQIVFMESTRDRRTPASRLSDGTLHWLMLALILLDDESTSPLFLEEPELGLHPDAILSLARLLKEASTRRQVLVTTHSSLLVSAFTESPECVFVFDRDEGGTRVERLSKKRILSWTKAGKSLADIWAAGAIGGNRW